MRSKIRESTKVKRYWPGKAPDCFPNDISSSDEEPRTILYKSVSTSDDDLRPRRLAKRRIDDDHKRRIRRLEIVNASEEEEAEEKDEEGEEEEEDTEDLEERRRRIKEKLIRQKEQGQEEEEYETCDDQDVSDEDNSEEEEDIALEVVRVKPIFVSKSTRDTSVERQKLEESEDQALEARRRELEERKRETKRMVLEEIRKDEEIQKGLMNQDSKDDDIDTDDDLGEDIKAWEARERARLKKERAVREAAIMKEIEIERMKNMSDKEREYREGKNPPLPAAPIPRKRKLKFMQRDRHRGAFFRSDSDDEGDILRRDYSAPTGKDKTDKTRLPKVMQVKNFGRRGRGKWTHLVNEDTTAW